MWVRIKTYWADKNKTMLGNKVLKHVYNKDIFVALSNRPKCECKIENTFLH